MSYSTIITYQPTLTFGPCSNSLSCSVFLAAAFLQRGEKQSLRRRFVGQKCMCKRYPTEQKWSPGRENQETKESQFPAAPPRWSTATLSGLKSTRLPMSLMKCILELGESIAPWSLGPHWVKVTPRALSLLNLQAAQVWGPHVLLKQQLNPHSRKQEVLMEVQGMMLWDLSHLNKMGENVLWGVACNQR